MWESALAVAHIFVIPVTDVIVCVCVKPCFAQFEDLNLKLLLNLPTFSVTLRVTTLEPWWKGKGL